MTYGQKLWMARHIADGLRALGLPVTQTALAEQLDPLDYTPPDPYAAGLAALAGRAGFVAAPPANDPAPAPDALPPNPYDAPLERLRREHDGR
jgi:hypothetical protein